MIGTRSIRNLALIGFMGAGTIMRYKASVRGLTTATSLWVVSGLGLAVGSGLYFGAIVTTLIAVIALMFFSRLEHVMIRKNWYKTIVIETKDGLEQLKKIARREDRTVSYLIRKAIKQFLEKS